MQHPFTGQNIQLTDVKAAASYPEDPGSNPVISMKNMCCTAAACLMRLWYIKSQCNGCTTEYLTNKQKFKIKQANKKSRKSFISVYTANDNAYE